MPKVAIIGTTSWGTTLAVIMARLGLEIWLCARTEQEATTLQSLRQNPRFLPDVEFPDSLSVTHRPDEALSSATAVFFVVPSRTLRDNAAAVSLLVESSSIIVTATKGLEIETGKRMSEILAEELTAVPGQSICALSGPNLASEIISGKPATTVVASKSMEAATQVQSLVNSPTFRVYTNDDIVGVELGGALKNIIALGAGICDGLRVGDNTKAAFMTRGLAEISRLAVAAGGNPLTLAGLAGMGDLIATCSSTLSRNHYVGEQIALGKSLSCIQETMPNVAEGVGTTAAALRLARTLGVEMPIAQVTFEVLFEGLPVDRAMSRLLERGPKAE